MQLSTAASTQMHHPGQGGDNEAAAIAATPPAPASAADPADPLGAAPTDFGLPTLIRSAAAPAGAAGGLVSASGLVSSSSAAPPPLGWQSIPSGGLAFTHPSLLSDPILTSSSIWKADTSPEHVKLGAGMRRGISPPIASLPPASAPMSTSFHEDLHHLLEEGANPNDNSFLGFLTFPAALTGAVTTTTTRHTVDRQEANGTTVGIAPPATSRMETSAPSLAEVSGTPAASVLALPITSGQSASPATREEAVAGGESLEQSIIVE